MAAEPVSAGNTDPDQRAGEQHREADGENREEVAVEPVEGERQGEPQSDEVEPEQQRQWGEYAFKTVAKLLNMLEVNSHEGQRYIAQYDEESQVLTIEAKDGRGEILCTEGSRVVESSLRAADVQVCERLNQRLEEQRQQQQQSKKQSRGLEMD